MQFNLLRTTALMLATTLSVLVPTFKVAADAEAGKKEIADPLKELSLEGAKVDLHGRIAFTVEVAGVESIFALDLDAKKFRRLIESAGSNSAPSWSSDGHSLAFASSRDGKKRIYMSNWDGADQARLSAQDVGSEDSPQWSSDGSKILFTRSNSDSADATESNIFSADVKGHAVTQVTSFKQKNIYGRWSPDEKRLSFTTNRYWPNWNICNYSLRDKKEGCLPNDYKSHSRSEWSHSGKLLLYSSGNTDMIDLALWETSSRTQSWVVANNGKNYDAEFSPDDAYVIFAHQEVPGGVYNLYIASPTDKETPPIKLVSSQYSLRYPTWSAARTYDLEAQQISMSQGGVPRRTTKAPTTAPPAPTVPAAQ